MTQPCRMILDVDTGIDDAMAILYALNRPGIRLEALTTTFGNTDVDTATGNTLRILELAGRADIPVARGSGRALLRPFVKGADHVHGANGLGDVILPAPKARPVAEHASDLIIRMARENPGAITLCPVGPITNVAIALAKAPDIATLLKEIVIMGSTIFHPGIQGIPSPMADANFWNDPEAAQIVLRSGAKIVLVGMDVTMGVRLTAVMREEIAREGGRVGATMMKIAQFYVDSYAAMYPGIDGCGLHDPLAVAIAEDPSLAATERMCVDIELAGALTRGQTVADRRRTAADRRNADVCMQADGERFSRRFVDALKSFSA
ncbi:nucleoside hydrolase [Methylocapsa sp. S129]|uniref:nucleoside hydrolase n=1 Tax=Methylocapsa sp. S129 TaxID=1641869 RepID=UPI00131B5D58|nr:nucleoside hydrolase [Methylocapsa sp. S129]